MTKPEIRMKSEIRNPKKSAKRSRCAWSFGLRILFGFLISGFVIPAHAADIVPGQKTQNVADVTVDPQTDQIIQGALKWLAAQQAPSGAWSEVQSPVAMTGYTTMAFLSCGHLPGEG